MDTKIPGDYRLTIGQRFFAHRFEMHPSSSRPNQRMYRLVDNLRYNDFVKAINYTVSSHAGLRIRLFRDKEEWRQFFPNQKARVEGDQVQGIKPEQCISYAKKVFSEEAHRPMDLQYECPIRAKVLKVNNQFWLSLCADHMAIDEIGFNLVEREIEKAYNAIINGRELRDCPQDRYINYLSKEELRRASEEKNLKYWQHQLTGAPMLIDTKQIDHVAANFYNYELKGEPYQILLDFCKKSKFSLFNVLTAVQLLIMAESSQLNDLVISFVIANRFNPDEQNLIINMVMLLHVRFIINLEEPLPLFLNQVKEKSIAALVHRNYDYASLYRFIAAESRKNDCYPNVFRECNLIIDEDPMVFPNALFLERIEFKHKLDKRTMSTGFNIYAEQLPKRLDVKITWDPTTWRITSDEMAIRFPQIINQLMG